MLRYKTCDTCKGKGHTHFQITVKFVDHPNMIPPGDKCTVCKGLGSVEIYQETPKEPDSSCFLTTACVAYRGLADNCLELKAMRNLRDAYILRHIPQGRIVVDDYYRTAPIILEQVFNQHRPDADMKTLWRDLIKPCTWDLQQKGHYAAAYNRYSSVVSDLSSQFIL